jgi:hypothetical protein
VKQARNPWVFGSLAIAYAAGLLLVLPWATEPGYTGPFLIGIYGTTIFAADCCTVVFLMRLYLRDRAHPRRVGFRAARQAAAVPGCLTRYRRGSRNANAAPSR